MTTDYKVTELFCFFDNKPKALQGYCIEDTKQLSLF